MSGRLERSRGCGWAHCPRITWGVPSPIPRWAPSRVEDGPGDHASFDFSSTDDAVSGPLNTTPFVAMAAVYYAIKAIVGPEIQPNSGC
jgi:Hydantoinase B/oxoprolinase